MLGQFKQRTFFSPLKTTGQHSFMNQKKKKKGITNVQTESSGEIRCHLAAFSHHALLLWGTGPDCPLWFGAFLRCSIFLLYFFSCCCLFFFFLYSAVLRDSFSSRKEHTQCEREKVNLSSKTSSGNINHVINEKKKCTSFNLFIYTFYTTVVITLGVFLVVSFLCVFVLNLLERFSIL